MIFSLKHVKAKISKVNEVPLFFFLKSLNATKISLSLFPKWFQPVYKRCPGVGNVFNNAFLDFKKLNKKQQGILIKAYRKSLDVKKICNDSSIFVPCIDDFDPRIRLSLTELFRFLFENTLDTESFKSVCGMHIKDHYDEFIRKNEIHVCPFCGLETYSLPDHRRAEYDHYFPITKYPLFGVNFNNLVPMGDICNGKKNDSDILYELNTRRLVTYPYQNLNYNLKVACKKQPTITDVYGEWEIDITAPSKKDQQRINTWDAVFNIKKQFASAFAIYHKRFAEDFARRNGLTGKVLSLSNLRKELKIYKANGPGDPKMDTMYTLRKAWADFYSTVKDDSELIVIKRMVQNQKPRMKLS